jgi:hypothetical protein
MTGEMIGSAIERALSMVGAIRKGPDTVDAEVARAAAEGQADAAQSIDNTVGPDLAGVLAQPHDPILVQRPAAGAGQTTDPRADEPAPAETGSPVFARLSKGRVAAVRRALFRL